MTGNDYKNLIRSIRKWCTDFDNTITWFVDDYDEETTENVPYGVVYSNLGMNDDVYLKMLNHIFQISYVADSISDLENMVANFIGKYKNGDGANKNAFQRIKIFDYTGGNYSTQVGKIQIERFIINPVIKIGKYQSQSISLYVNILEY